MPRYGWFVALIFLLVACGGKSEEAKPASVEIQPSLEARPLRPNGLESTTIQSVNNPNQITLADGRQVYLLSVANLSENDPLYAEAKRFLESLILNKDVSLELGPADQAESYYLWSDQLLVNYEILRAGFGRYTASRSQYDVFLQYAQDQAQKENLGIWKTNNIPLRIDLVVANARNANDLNNEWLEIRNEGSEILDISGFSIRSNSNLSYTFAEETQIHPYKTLKLYTGCGENRVAEVYWCAEQSIWGTNETALLTDAQAQYIHHRDILSNARP